MIRGHEFAFVTPAPILGAGRSAYSPSATATARSLLPVLALNGLGYDAAAYSLAGPEVDISVLQQGAKALVFGDLAAAQDVGQAAASYRRILDGVASSARVLFDLVSPLVEGSERFDFYLDACKRASAMTAGSEHVARSLRASTPCPIDVVVEPFDSARGAPRAVRLKRRSRLLDWLARRAGIALDTWRLRLLWSGDSAGVDSIVRLAPSLQRLGRRTALALHCVCPQDALDELARELREEDPDALTLAFEAWSPATMAQALALSDLVLLPGTRESAAAAQASRLIASIQAGRLALAHPSPYFGRLGDFAWVGDDLCQGIEWALAGPPNILSRLAQGQAYLDQVHAPAIVARAWVAVLMQTRKK